MDWYKDDVLIVPEAGDTRITIECDPDRDLHLLIIQDADSHDAGEYMALAINDHGSFRFRITVIVADSPPPPQQKIRKTIKTKRTVSVVEEMLVDGKVVERTVVKETMEEDEPGELGVEEASVLITDITDQLSTSHTVTSSDLIDFETTSTVTSEEGTPPTFVKPPEPVYVDIGEDINLSCQVKG